MVTESELVGVLAAYPDDCRSGAIQSLGSAGGFSGARFWRLKTKAGPLCLRRWPRGGASPERLEFIQAVLWHVVREGFERVPLPLSTCVRKGYVHHAGFFWELAPWMPGTADFAENPTPEKLRDALATLAEFHLAAASFPLPNPPAGVSPGICGRLDQLRSWLTGGIDRLCAAVKPGLWPDLERRAEMVFHLVPKAAGGVLTLLETAVAHEVPLQPCIRDVWRNHVLFEGDRVSGLIDFGSMGADNVAADVARLLGSMARDDARMWQAGLAAYRSVRPLSEAEVSLVYGFDRSTVVMAGLNWIDWIYRERRDFDRREAIPARLDEILARLEHLAR